jgi:hypothetical protein
MKKLTLEYNPEYVPDLTVVANVGHCTILATPPIDDDYWIMRVPVSENQAIVTFPKFCTYGIGFQHEDDWNTNLPYRCDAEEIYNHIRHNKGDKRITKAKCLDAIRLLQAAIREMVGS